MTPQPHPPQTTPLLFLLLLLLLVVVCLQALQLQTRLDVCGLLLDGDRSERYDLLGRALWWAS
jgi:hypothetical protein